VELPHETSSRPHGGDRPVYIRVRASRRHLPPDPFTLACLCRCNGPFAALATTQQRGVRNT